jgi:hypothetical protein
MKRPNKIEIAGYTFSIKWDKTRYDGHFSFENNQITIGTRSDNENEIFSILLHEITEICSVIHYVRHHDRGNDSYFFLMNHKQYSVLIQEVSKIVYKFFT